MSEAEQFVLDALVRHERLNRFELMTMIGSPLTPKKSYYTLRDMEDKGLITSRLEAGHSSHRWYRKV
jgi:DNA-binding PadR family transcriptional regulator